MKNAPQLFIIPADLIASVAENEVEATARDLRELGLFKLPYETVDIQMPADNVIKTASGAKLGPDGIFTLHGLSIDPGRPIRSAFTWTTNRKWSFDLGPYVVDEDLIRRQMCDLLITLLATRNVIKSTTICKAARLGIGKGRHEYTTTLSLPREPDRDPTVPTGREVAPHLRRGHIRRQHYGPRNSFVKSIWIDPVIVNADKEFVSTRKAYNVSLIAPIPADRSAA